MAYVVTKAFGVVSIDLSEGLLFGVANPKEKDFHVFALFAGSVASFTRKVATAAMRNEMPPISIA